MSDDLIERLDFCAKLHPQFGNLENGKLFAQAAARIRELEAQAAQSVKVKPLEWKSFGTMAFVADAPLFGRLRVERFGRDGSWTICFSVPGFCDTFLDGEWPDAESAKVAAQADYERRIVSALEPAPLAPAEARENVVDTIEEIICETHDLDVRDRDYAESVVAWLEKYHPAALRAIAGEGE